MGFLWHLAEFVSLTGFATLVFAKPGIEPKAAKECRNLRKQPPKNGRAPRCVKVPAIVDA